MDLHTAFGPAYNSPLGTAQAVPPEQPVPPEEIITESPAAAAAVNVQRKTVKKPDTAVYVIQFNISKEDVHLLGMFLLVFAISIMLNRSR